MNISQCLYDSVVKKEMPPSPPVTPLYCFIIMNAFETGLSPVRSLG